MYLAVRELLTNISRLSFSYNPFYSLSLPSFLLYVCQLSPLYEHLQLRPQRLRSTSANSFGLPHPDQLAHPTSTFIMAPAGVWSNADALHDIVVALYDALHDTKTMTQEFKATFEAKTNAVTWDALR